METILYMLIALTCFFQAWYAYHAFFVKVDEETDDAPASEAISIIIPLHNSATTLGLCLDSVLRNASALIARIVVVVDHCDDDSPDIARSYIERFAGAGVALQVVETSGSARGKVAAILEGGRHVATTDVLLLDADITLAPGAVAKLTAFHAARGSDYSSCLIYPWSAPRSGTLPVHLICNNRLYRQGVLQNVKNRFGVANFPGGVQLVRFNSYRELLVDGFLEDLVATYQVLSTGGAVSILSAVLAYEVERQTIRGLLLQRIRWTIGAIENLPAQMRAAHARSGAAPKILIYSYHVMWELQHYVMTLGLVMTLVTRGAQPFYLAPLLLYAIQIGRSAFLGRRHYSNSLLGIVFHCLWYPVVLSAAFVCSVALLIRNRSFFFRAELLFRRD
jgi:cellulose synthase/poly-beta-1,6-N-acetylglucosamine synthase-like glycosyltransferase